MNCSFSALETHHWISYSLSSLLHLQNYSGLQELRVETLNVILHRMESLRLPPKSVFLPRLHWQEGAMRHNSGRLLGNKRRSHHPGDSHAGVFICVSNSILLVCVTISTLFLCHVCSTYRLIFYIHSPHFYLQTSSLHSPYSIDGQSTHCSIDRVPSSTIITLDLPPSEDCRLVEWAQMTYKNIRHVLLLNRHQHQPNNPPYASRSLQY